MKISSSLAIASGVDFEWLKFVKCYVVGVDFSYGYVKHIWEKQIICTMYNSNLDRMKPIKMKMDGRRREGGEKVSYEWNESASMKGVMSKLHSETP